MSSPKIALPDVLDAELDEVMARRRAIGLLPQADQCDEQAARRDVQNNLVGLALSGGGIRSATFNLGLLQALLQSGVMRYIDYLSTVSGGGYIGAFLSSLAFKRNRERKGVAPEPKELLQEASPLRPDANGGQPEEVRQLAAHSHYLNDLLGFFNRYLIGVVLLNATLFSAIVFLATLAAFVWRLLDTPPVVEFLLWLSGGRILEWNRPFLIGVLLLGAWAAIWGFCFLFRGNSADFRFLSKLLAAAAVSLLVGLAIWLGTPNMNFTNVVEADYNPQTQTFANGHQDFLYPLLALLLVCLLPFIRPKELLQSGMRQDSFWRRGVFFTAGFALAVGVPFAVVYWIGQHNISGVASHWKRPLVAADFLDWEYFFASMNAEAETLAAESDPLAQEHLLTPGVLFKYALAGLGPGQRQPLPVLDKAKAAQYQRSDPSASWADYWQEEKEKAAFADRLTELLQGPEFAETFLSRAGCRAEIQARLAQLRQSKPAEADKLSRLVADRAFRADHPEHIQEPNPIGYDAQTAGHLLLRAYYPECFRPIHFVSRPLVIVPDQWRRLEWLGISLLVCLVLGLVINLNWTSIHGFYRAQLRKTFIVSVPAEDGSPREPKLQELKNSEEGLPYHLLTGSVSLTPGEEPSGQETTSFLFSQRYCGGPLLGYCATGTYRRGENDLSNAVAISGAAVNPLRAGNLLLRLVLTVMNFRLGQWLPNPGRQPAPRWPRFVPPLRIAPAWLGQFLWWRPVHKGSFVFVADGGFHENLGIEALLDRRCRLILASDAGADPKFLFDDYVKLHRHCRMRGIRMESLTKRNEPLAMDDIIPSGEPPRQQFSRQHQVFGLIRYPDDDRPALLIYVKSSLTDPETIDVRQFRATHPGFPNETTLNQFFDAAQFEAYRELGYRIGLSLCQNLKPSDWGDDPIPVEKLIALLASRSIQAKTAAAQINGAAQTASDAEPAPVSPQRPAQNGDSMDGAPAGS
jgi:hypothetical protein